MNVKRIYKIAILLTVHNRKDKTIKCLRCLSEQTKTECHNLSVYVTNDGCTDGTPEAIRDEFPNTIILDGNGQLYWNRGMEFAWKRAIKDSDYDFYLWLNDDTILKEDAINTLIESAIQTRFQSIIVGSTESQQKILSYGGRKADINNTLISPNNERLVYCDTFNGNIVLIPKFVVQKIGIINHLFRHSFGDIEYGFRARKKGLKSYIAPGILGVCDRNEGVPRFLNKSLSVTKRLKALYSPLGFNPKESFYLDYKYRGIHIAILRFIKLHFNALLPSFFTAK